MPQRITRTYLDNSIFWLYVIFFISIVFSLRGVSSIAIGLILINGAIKAKKDCGSFFTNDLLSPFFIGCVLLYILKCISLLYTNDLSEGLKHLERESGLILIPLAVYSSSTFLNIVSYRKLMTYFTVIIFAATVLCLVMAIQKYNSGNDQSAFFYHYLVRPLGQHAIQFSILVFFELVFLYQTLKRKIYKVSKTLLFFLIIYFSFFLFLLSSKLVLAFYLVYAVYSIISIKKNSQKPYVSIIAFAFLLTIAVSLLTAKNPIGNRFREIAFGNLELIKQEKFTQANYFNGLQFRLLQWRFVYEILNENNSWILGLSPGDSQKYLDQKYVSTGMYTGKVGTTDRGFLGYNTHNQFLESLLQTGIIGLIAFSFICYALIKEMVKQKNSEFRFIILLLLAFSITDTTLETQYGLILFTFFPIFLKLCYKKDFSYSK
jgi:O-antigen ligase